MVSKRNRAVVRMSLTAIPLVCLLAFAGFAIAQEPAVVQAGGIVFRFATAAQGRQLLAREDDFVRRMSPMDRKIRMRVGTDPGQDAYLKFVADEVIEWPEDLRERMTQTIQSLQQPLSKFALPDPGEVILVHTTGREESGAAYTRGSVIVLPRGMLASPFKPPTQRLLAHELFHVLSRSDPQWRDQLYATIGFRLTNEIVMPPSLADRKLTNPDAPLVKHVIDVQLDDQRRVTVAPVLFAKSDFVADQTSLFSYVDFKLMEVIPIVGKQWIPNEVDGETVLHDSALPDYHRQIGGNTKYIIHPEEILADNFSMLVTGANVKDEWVLEAVREIVAPSSRPSVPSD